MPSQLDSRNIAPGTILMERGTLLPAPLRLEDDGKATGWTRVAGNVDGRQLEHDLSSAGWTFFYTAGAIRSTAFGFDRPKMILAALKRLVSTVKLHRCNCLEIDLVTTHSFLGLPYLSLTGHLRHVQKGLDEQGSDEQKGQS